MTEETSPLKENDVGTYKGKAVRLLYPAAPLPGWIAVELIGSMGGRRRTGNRVYIENEYEFDKLVLKSPQRRIIITQYAIYDHPKDYPNNFVVRRWDVVRGIPVAMPSGNPVLAETLEEARAAVPAGLTNIGRLLGDDSVILEVWT